MKKTFLKIICALVVVGATVPTTSHAYKVTDSQAVRLSDDYVLFTISYRFGFLNREARMPILAAHGTSTLLSDIEYIVEDSNQAPVDTPIAAALVLSPNAELQHNLYHIPEGRNRDFTLMVLVAARPESKLHSLKVQDFPFYLIDGNKTWLTTVPPRDLIGYTTKGLQ